MTDGTKKKIKMPAWHVPYLEKHNIYKLFYELARELVIQQPDDHVFFMKFLLANAVKNIYTPRVILLGSPRINMLEIGTQVAAKTKQILITEPMVLELLKKKKDQIGSKDYVLGIQAVMHMHGYEMLQHGWIIVDCVRNKSDAQQLLNLGIIPTHVIYLVSPFSPKLNDLLYCNVTEKWPDFRRNMSGIKEVFQKKLVEVYLHEFLIHDIITKCVELISIERIQDGPKQPRILLLGPRGSGRKTQAKMLEQKFNIIHIDFEYLLCQAWIGDTELGKKLKAQGDGVCFRSKLLAEVLNKRLLDLECLERGWVLTGFPFNVGDFKCIDCLETPPNRVIFLECDLNVCFERVANRKINANTGSVTHMDIDYHDIAKKLLKLHPKDKSDIINAELQYYCTQYGSLRKYAGMTGNCVNADQSIRWVHENITAIIIRDLPISTPRNPFGGHEKPHLNVRSAMDFKVFKPDK